MQTFSLNSGSNGNAIYVEAGDVRLLFDAGLAGKTAEQRMAVHGRDIRDVDAVIVSHDHTDHIRYAGTWHRKFGLPVYMTQRTQQATWCKLGRFQEVRYFHSGDTLHFNGVTVHTIRTAHDAADGVAFVVEHEGRRLGILTDLGHAFDGLCEVLRSVHAAYLESNYEPELLERSPYPWWLKQRIRGAGGHLSNQDAAGVLRACGRELPGWVAVAHLSADNNDPELAAAAHHEAIGRDYPVHVASRYRTSPIFSV